MTKILVTIVLLSFCKEAWSSDEAAEKVIVDCTTLRLGQFICPDPSINQIDPDTQQFRGCEKGKEFPSEGEAKGTFTLFITYITLHYSDLSSRY